MYKTIKTIKLNVPDDIELNTIFYGQIIFQLKSEWRVNGQNFSQGTVISISYNDLPDGKKNFELVVQPNERSSVTQISNTKEWLLVNMLVNVKSELFAMSYENGWERNKLDAPAFGNLSLGSSDELSN